MDEQAIIEEILVAQADLQTALGFLLLPSRGGKEILRDGGIPDSSALDRLARSLARLQRLLADLGNPMYQPVQHPDITGKPVHAPVSDDEEPGSCPLPKCKWCEAVVYYGRCQCKHGEGRYSPEREECAKRLDIARETIKAVQRLECDGGWQTIATGELLEELHERERDLLERWRA